MENGHNSFKNWSLRKNKAADFFKDMRAVQEYAENSSIPNSVTLKIIMCLGWQNCKVHSSPHYLAWRSHGNQTPCEGSKVWISFSKIPCRSVLNISLYSLPQK
jgi:hypothetical protein